MLVDTEYRDTKTTIFGHEVAAPIGIAPIGINTIYHPTAEAAAAKVAGELNIPYSLSTAGSRSFEEVARANEAGYKDSYGAKAVAEAAAEATTSTGGSGGKGASGRHDSVGIGSGEGKEGIKEAKKLESPRFYQLYMPHDDELTESLLLRAHKSGFSAILLTVDTPQLGWRHDDIATSNYAFYRGIGAGLGLTDPVFRKRCIADPNVPNEELNTGADDNIAQHPIHASAKWIDNIWHGRAWGWEKVIWVRDLWKSISGGKPFVIKGIQSVHDAKKCVELGIDGIVVSNHAGRQVDGAIASLDALENIVNGLVDTWGKGVLDKFTVMFDSGVRGAADVVKALALGARFVFVGRLYVWGMSIMGETGVRHVLRALLADLDILMAVAGLNSVDEIDRSLLGMYLPPPPSFSAFQMLCSWLTDFYI